MKVKKNLLRLLLVGGIVFFMGFPVKAAFVNIDDEYGEITSEIDEKYKFWLGRVNGNTLVNNYKPRRGSGFDEGGGGIGTGGGSGGSGGSGNGSGTEEGSGSGSGSGNGGSEEGGSTGNGRYSYASFQDVLMGDITGIYKDENGYWISYESYVQFVDNIDMTLGIAYPMYMKIMDGGADVMIKNSVDRQYSSKEYRDMFLYNVSDATAHDELQSNLFLDKQPIPFLYEYDEEGKLKKKINLFTYSEFMYWGISSTGVVEIDNYNNLDSIAEAHDFEDFSAASNPSNWSIMHKVGRNNWNDVGASYDGYGFPFSRSKIQSMSGQTINGGGTPFRNLKVIGQILGIDSLNNQKLWDKSAGIDSSSRMMFNTNELIAAMIAKTETVTIDENSNFAELFSLASLGVSTNEFHSLFLTVDGQNATPRWVWGCSPGVAGSFANSLEWGRDVTPDSNFSLQSYLRRWSGSSFEMNSNTAVFPNSANQEYLNPSLTASARKNGIKTYIIVNQIYPEFMNEAFRRGVGTTYAKSIEELNTLAETNYSAWFSCLTEQADWFFEKFAVSNFCTAGEGCTVGIAKNSTYYSAVSVARSIPVEVEVVTPISDLVLSNEKNEKKKYNMLNTITWSTNESTNSYGLPTNGWEITSYVSDEPNVGLDENNTIDKDYETGNHQYSTSIYVGRIPNMIGLKETERKPLKLSDFSVVATSDYNEDNFVPSIDSNIGGKDYLYQLKGTAQEILENAFRMFIMDNNPTYISRTFSRGTDARLYAQPVRYKIPEGEITNFSGKEVIPMSAWTQVTNLNTEIPEGAIIEYKLDYKLPSANSIRQEMNLETGFSLYNKGSWWDDYQTVLNSNVSFDIISKNDTAYEQNIFTENDFTKMRVIKPKVRDMYISKVEIYRSDKSTPIITKEAGRSETGFCKLNSEGLSVEEIVIPKSIIKELQVNQNTGQYTADLYVKIYYNYHGKNDIPPIGQWAKINVNNGFSGVVKDVNATTVNGYSAINDGSNISCMKIELNKVMLNENKDKMLVISVPVGENNECRKDWEIVKILIENESTNKDNEVLDIMLVDSSLVNESGDTSIYRGGSYNLLAQTIAYEPSKNYYLLVAVRRKQPTDMMWDESKKNGSLDGTLCITYEKNGEPHIQILSAPNVTGNYRWGEGKQLGYSKSNSNCFCKVGDVMYYKFSVGNNVKELDVTAFYRVGDDISSESVDYEDFLLLNNSWREIWETQENPNFVLDIVDGQANVQKYKTVTAGGLCPSTPEIIYPYLEFTVAQTNPNAIGSWSPRVHVTMNGKAPKSVSGLSYMGNGVGVITFNGGDTSERTIYAQWDELPIYWGIDSSNNKTYTMNPHINYGCCLNVPNEITQQDNHKEWRFTTNLNCDLVEENIEPSCCIFALRRNQDARVFYGAGKIYYWDTQFKWTHQNTYRDEAVNVKPREHLMNCPCVSKYETIHNSDGTTSKILIEYREHEHCYCFCTVEYDGPNNNKIYWRSRDIGYSKYYERFEIHIMVESSAHGLRDIAGGATRIYDGETFRFWFETVYESNRDSLPITLHEPFSQPFTTGLGGQGCFPCNILTRYPDYVEDIIGPNTVDIKVSGTSYYDTEKYNITPDAVLDGRNVHKHYAWYPIPDDIFVQDNQVVAQIINLYICVYDFLGYTSDSGIFDGGVMPGYAWETREKQAYCDATTGTIVILPSRTYIGSSQEEEGLDGQGVLNDGDSDSSLVDGDVWIY